MQAVYTIHSGRETRKLGEILAAELRGGEIICLTGELGSGKTTFTQGILKGLKTKGPYTSPTFVVMKEYGIKSHESGIKKAYHFDAYRVGVKDILDLGWEEIIANKKNVVIIEWAEKIRRIIPERAIWIKFKHKGKEIREITIC